MHPNRFVQYLRAVRAWAGLTQEELAAQLEVGKRSLTRWESGDADPSPRGMEAIATWAQARRSNVTAVRLARWLRTKPLHTLGRPL